jgi:hypothetical protein
MLGERRLEPIDVVPPGWQDGYVWAPLPEEALGPSSIRLSFGYAKPIPEIGLKMALYYQGSLERAPSAWSEDGTPPPLGVLLVPRGVGVLERLAGKARFEQPLLPPHPDLPPASSGRYGIELWLVGQNGEVCATCY